MKLTPMKTVKSSSKTFFSEKFWMNVITTIALIIIALIIFL